MILRLGICDENATVEGRPHHSPWCKEIMVPFVRVDADARKVGKANEYTLNCGHVRSLMSSEVVNERNESHGSDYGS